MRTWTVSIYSQDPYTDGVAKPSIPPPIPAPVMCSHEHLSTDNSTHPPQKYIHSAPEPQPRMSRYTGEALARLWSML